MAEVAGKEFLEIILDDPVAFYAAALSTVIAITASIRFIYKKITDGPKAWVELVHPLQSYMKSSEIIISNVGNHPFTVRELRFNQHKSRKDAPYKTSTHNHKTLFDPSIKLVPDPTGKPNTKVREPRILRPGDEDHHLARPSDGYDPSRDWLSVEVFIRGVKKPQKAWCAPLPEEVDKDE